MAIKRIIVGKFGTCAGQACIAIDYIIVEKGFTSTLVRSLNDIHQVSYFAALCFEFDNYSGFL